MNIRLQALRVLCEVRVKSFVLSESRRHALPSKSVVAGSSPELIKPSAFK
ncbi:hypothetical protein TSAR_016747 [Trichomalopsis sarcophagae]|uniref:Uncharacterized protein n=1 Tax=Trichomalopsis sarcophagae TaxID=543379 RepID=A0A232EF73_9HYME|nr:hypothetical protein TSAR_016747 [Trichomalopsis sarcophagae]